MFLALQFTQDPLRLRQTVLLCCFLKYNAKVITKLVLTLKGGLTPRRSYSHNFPATAFSLSLSHCPALAICVYYPQPHSQVASFILWPRSVVPSELCNTAVLPTPTYFQRRLEPAKHKKHRFFF